MSKTIFLIFLLNTTLLPLDLSNIQDLTNWEKIQDEPVKIEWTKYKGFPISRSEIILGHPIDKVFNTIQSLESYPEIFHRVEKAIRLDTNIVQIMLDMPFPFSGRDYVIRYETKRQKHQYILLFWSVNHNNEIKSESYVRLPNACGIWLLDPINNSETRVIYCWNGELLGNFPNFGLKEAWITQGTEVLLWLDKSLKENKL